MSVLRPGIDPLYAPADPSTRPGELLRSRQVKIATDVDATAWQLVYGSTP